VWQHIAVIPAHGRLRQEIKASLGYAARSCFKEKKKKKNAEKKINTVNLKMNNFGLEG
jgi:hypothetical protein